MQPRSSSPSLSLLLAQDNDYQTHYRTRLEWIDQELLMLRQRPSFLSFVNHSFNAAFTSSEKPLQSNRIFITSHTQDEVVIPADVSVVLLPSVLDAVVRRIVDKQPASFASRLTTFSFGRGEEDDKDLPASLTPAAFDTFVDNVAVSLQTAYQAHLDTFWNKTLEGSARSYKQKVISRREDQLRVEATLLRGDGTLNSGGVLLVEEFLAFSDASARQGRPYRAAAYALALKDGSQSPNMPLHGALVLTSRDPSYSESDITATLPPPSIRPIQTDANVGFVVLFTPNQGLEAFASLALLDKELHRRLNKDHEFESVFALLADRYGERATTLRNKVQQADCFDYTEILESVFSASVESQYQKLIQDFMFMVGVYQARGVQTDMSQLPDSLDLTTDMSKLFSLSGVLMARETKRSKAELNAFLRTASETDKAAWAAATRDYLQLLQSACAADGLPSISQFGDRTALLDYSRTRLSEVLEIQYGIDADPDDIRVTIRRPNPAGGIYFSGARPNPQTGQARYKVQTKTLTELAVENVEYFDQVFVDKSRLSLNNQPYTELTPQHVKDLVRELDIGSAYEGFLTARLLTSHEAQSLKKDFVRVMEKQLRVDALEAKIAGDYSPDSLDRAYHWVKSVLDHPTQTDQRATVGGHGVIVSALVIRDIAVRGVLVFRSASSTIHSKVVYTPRAPGGRVFHEYESSTQLLERFINNSAWHDYLFDNMEGAYQPRLRRKLASGIYYTEFDYLNITRHVFERAYDIEARNAIEKANRNSTSTHEADVRSVWTIVEGVVEVALAVLPVRITFVIGLVRSAFALNQAVEALQKDDSVAASYEFVRAFSHLIGALVDGAIGFAPVRVGGVPGHAGLPSDMALRAVPKDVTPLVGWEGKGIYTRAGNGAKPGQHFLHEKGQWYKVTYDEVSGAKTWRLQKPRRSAEHSYHLPPIAQNALNEWVIRSPEIGLKGGVHSRMARDDLMRLYPDLGPQAAGRVLDSFQFPAGAERAWELRFSRRLWDSQAPLQQAFLREIPSEFHQYLIVPLDQARLRMQGIDQIAGTAPVAVTPVRASVIQSNHWKTWGKVINSAVLEVHPGHPSIYRYKNVPGTWWRHQEGNFIKVGGAYYRLTDKSEITLTPPFYVRNPDTAYNTFDSFELMLRHNPAEQPRLATYNRATSTWHVSNLMSFEKSLVSYAADIFPELTPGSQVQLVRAMFTEFASISYSNMNFLREWRTGAFRSNDPISMMEYRGSVAGANPRYNIGRVTEDVRSGAFGRLDFSFNALHPHLHHAITRPGPATLRPLMVEAMRHVARVDLVESLSSSTRLFFQRAGDVTLYCLHCVNVSETFVRTNSFQLYNPSLMTSTGLVRSAVQANKLINLVGGIQRSARAPQQAQVFIFKIIR
jgi:hypothetical protein